MKSQPPSIALFSVPPNNDNYARYRQRGSLTIGDKDCIMYNTSMNSTQRCIDGKGFQTKNT